MNTKLFFSSATDKWSTPADLYEALAQEFLFDFDPCPIDPTEDGRTTRWSGRRVYCNPPYGRGVGKWLERGPDAEVAVFLLPARTDTKWFHELVLPVASEVRFLQGRLKFGGFAGNSPAPFPSMLVIFRGRRHLEVHAK
jgi:DNA N-6-adenine-methyltransferase (Dam)